MECSGGMWDTEVIAVTDQPKNALVIDRGGCIMEDVEQGITIFGGFLKAILEEVMDDEMNLSVSIELYLII